MDLIGALGTFVRIAETGSFSAVARERGTTQSAVSRQITALEEEFGVRLLQRTTRRLALTEDGQDTLEHARNVLEAVNHARDAAARRRGEASGTVRLAAPMLIGCLVSMRVPVLLAQHPNLSLQLIATDRVHDMVEEGLDLWLRVGESTHATHVSRVVGHTSPVLLAAPDYLAVRGRPEHPRDLAAHDCLVQHRLGADHVWRFTGPEGNVTVPVAGRFSADNADAVLRAALAGAGIALVAEVVARAEIAAGRLMPLLPGFEPAGFPITLIYPSRRNLAPRVRAVIDFIIQDILRRPDPFAELRPPATTAA
ncbi:MAG: LysR family transcriptional regulator [Rhodospirillales bacterium]|jgi:DNA-binding transcriptional LysR family regulator|nr:LysR family transcriptional regulator [Rhodospirillales bacterium]